MKTMDEKFWTERSVPGSPSWPFFRGRALSRYYFAFPYARGKRVIDVACGTGHGSHLLASEGGAAEVVGIDISEDAVGYAREHYAAPNIRYLHGDSQRLDDLALADFDLVTSMGTLEHVKAPDLFARGVLGALKPGGVWLVTMLNPTAHEGMDEHHFHEWNLETFHQFLGRHFDHFEIRWHVILPAGKEKISRTAARYSFLPEWFKAGVKKLMGRQASLKASQVGARFCEPEDYTWSSTRDDSALEFLGVARK